MRLGLVENGTYKTTSYDDLTGYKLEVNGFSYDFGRVIEETRVRVRELWGFDCPADMLRTRLHFSEEKYFNRMVKNEHYGIFSRHTGAHVCLGLVSEEETYNLVIHEIGHEIHYRQGTYDGADEVVQEAAAIMAEEEYAIREFDWDPHFTAQQLLWQLKDFAAFGQQPFGARWELLTKVRSAQQLSYLINRYLDDENHRQFQNWLDDRFSSAEATRNLLNAVAVTSQKYASYNRQLLLNRLCDVTGPGTLNPQQNSELLRALTDLRKLDAQYPQESLTNLMQVAFGNI